MPKHEIVIVGAGPGGSLLAYLLADAGRDVLLLEKSRNPGTKPCGGGITPKTKEILPVKWDAVVEDECRGATLSFHRAVNVTWPEPVCFMVQRSCFDGLMREAAREAGAALNEETCVQAVEAGRDGVTLRTDHGRVTAGLVVGADGAHSRVAQILRKPGRRAFGLVTKVRPDAERLEAHRGKLSVDFGVVPGGYGWVFPKQDHLNVGVYSIGPRASSLALCLDRYLRKTGLEKSDQSGRRGFPISLDVLDNRVVARDRVLLIGDAAGLADPLTGEGIHTSCLSAMLAAEAILGKPAGDRGIALSYQQAVQQLIIPELCYTARLAGLFYRFAGRVMSYLEQRPRLVREFWGAVFMGRSERIRPFNMLRAVLADLRTV